MLHRIHVSFFLVQSCDKAIFQWAYRWLCSGSPKRTPPKRRKSTRYTLKIRRTQVSAPNEFAESIHTATASADASKIVYTVPRAEVVEALNQALYQPLKATASQVKSNAKHRTTEAHDRQNHASDHPDMMTSLADVAYLCERQGRHQEAERLYKQVLLLRRRQLNDEPHLDDRYVGLVNTLEDLAKVYYHQQRYGEAQLLLEEAWTLRQKHLPAYHSDCYSNYHSAYHNEVGDTLYRFADTYRHLQMYGKAEPLFQQALSIYREHLGPQHPKTESVYSDFMQMLVTAIEAGKFDELSAELPPLDLDNLSALYTWAKPSWERAKPTQVTFTETPQRYI
ncbi:MAG: tetratricopeptide repeat protein [Phormidesmis sp. RL_2_1]|nr:tetratricopeptide repeat protein [Phormidesmis sp. RL_2_1]